MRTGTKLGYCKKGVGATADAAYDSTTGPSVLALEGQGLWRGDQSGGKERLYDTVTWEGYPQR